MVRGQVQGIRNAVGHDQETMITDERIEHGGESAKIAR